MNSEDIYRLLVEMESTLLTRIEELERKVDSLIAEKKEQVEQKDEDTVENADPETQLALLSARVKPEVRELIAFTASQMGAQVYREVIEELNEKVVPQVAQMVDFVNYSLQDGQEVVDDHRRRLETQINGLNPDTKLLTDGRNDKRIISPYVRTVWGGPDEDSSTDD